MTTDYERFSLAFAYDQHTGHFHHRVAIRGKPAGARADYNRGRYQALWLDGKAYGAHRVAYLLMEKKWPEQLVDHEDRNTRNNAWANLRPATPSQNRANSKQQGTNVKGTTFDKRSGKIKAQIKVNGSQKTVGRFATRAEAHAAYVAAAIKYFGSFANGGIPPATNDNDPDPVELRKAA